MRRTTRAVARRWASACALALIGLLVALPAVAPVVAADPVTITARGLLGGRFTTGDWAAVAVSLANDGAPVIGTLSADSESGEVRRTVELPAGSRKEVVLYVRPAAFTRELPIQFTSDAGTVTAVAELAGLDRGGTTIALVGDGAASLRTQIADRDQGATLAPFDVPATDFPERPEPLRGLSVIVWAGDSTALTEGQRQTLERWVAGGGQLIVVGGPDWQARAAAFTPLLPVTNLEAVDDVSVAPLAALGGELPEGVTALTVATGEIATGARSLVALGATDDRPLIAMAPRGAGRVVWIAADLAAPAFSAWDEGGAIWSRLLGNDAALQFIGGRNQDEEAAAMTQALTNLPALEVPPAELLLVLIVGYILLIGPVSYVLLRRVDRRELAWVTAPLLVVLFSACSYGIGTSLKGTQLIVNQISVIRSVAGGTAANVTTWAGIFSPARATYDLSVAGDALLAGVSTGGTGTTALPTEQGDPAHLRGLAVNVFGLRAIRADTLVPREPGLSVNWRLDGRRIVGSVTNLGADRVTDVAVLTMSSGKLVGDLDPGETRDFEMAAADFTGVSPADQVYGFAGAGDDREEQRRRGTRRQVLAGLVGYGGGMPVSAFGVGADRGPYVVGWHEGSPTDVVVDDQDVQRFSQSVEVVSGRPEIDPGSVEVRAIDIGSRVVASEGQVDRPDPASVVIGAGSATFELALPLDLADLKPTEITLWVAGDPGTALMEQGVGGGMFPRGYLLEVLDPASGTWTSLGDLATNNRFAVPDPARHLDPDGVVTARVIGDADAADGGRFSIYVAASMKGSLQ